MLKEVYLFMAIVGGAVFTVQFLMSLFALGGHRIGGHRASTHTATHAPGPTTTHRVAGPTPITHAPAGGARPGAARLSGHRGTARAARHGGPRPAAGQKGTHAYATTAVHLLLAMLDFQAMIAGATVFGLAGLASSAFGFHAGGAVAIAVVAGILAMALVITLLQIIEHLDEDGTIQLDQAVGKVGTVYLSIPAQRGGLGKVVVSVQDRSMELPAFTLQESPIATGAKVVVVGLEEPNIAQVMPADRIPGLEVQL